MSCVTAVRSNLQEGVPPPVVWFLMVSEIRGEKSVTSALRGRNPIRTATCINILQMYFIISQLPKLSMFYRIHGIMNKDKPDK